jgi:hypothetical protein
MKFVHVPMHCAFLPLLVLLSVSCCDEGGDYGNRSAQRRGWRTSSSLSNARHSEPTDMVMQVRLQGLGYDPGPINGLIGSQTKTALMRYQREHGLLASGLPGPATRARLMPASIRLTGGYRLMGSTGGRLRGIQLGPRYPGDIQPFIGAGDAYDLSPCNGTSENFYRILRPEKRRE